MRVLVVAGTRPNFMKIAPIMAALKRARAEALLVHTGQHYDESMSGTFFDELGIPDPDFHLNVGSGSHAAQTARIMEAFEPVLLEAAPDWLVVVGDVNSTLAAALVTAKLRDQTGCRIAHVEAGLRSNDWRMPEEVNRVLTDRLADLLLTPSRDARKNLLREGLDDSAIAFVGNVMIDTLHAQLPAARELRYAETLGVQGQYAVATLHRPSNVDEKDSLAGVLGALAKIAAEMPVIFPAHPRTQGNAKKFGLDEALSRLTLVPPVGYREMLSLTSGSAVVLTDSGGLQEETTALGIPCVTLREQTERPITITEGTNRLAPWPLTSEGVHLAFTEALRDSTGEPRVPEGWDGKAAERVVAELSRHGRRE